MDLLLVLKLPVYLVDEVFAELTSDPLYQKDREVVEFVTGHADTVHVVDTLVGRTFAAARTRGEMTEKQHGGEAAIAEFLSSGIERIKSPEDPALVLLEDSDIATSAFFLGANVHLLSTVAFLRYLEQLHVIPSAEQLLEKMTHAGRAIHRVIDIPSSQGEEESEWDHMIPR